MIYYLKVKMEINKTITEEEIVHTFDVICIKTIKIGNIIINIDDIITIKLCVNTKISFDKNLGCDIIEKLSKIILDKNHRINYILFNIDTYEEYKEYFKILDIETIDKDLHDLLFKS